MTIKEKTEFFCEACTLEKQARKFFKQNGQKIEKLGMMIHFDICGPINIESAGGVYYFLLFKNAIQVFALFIFYATN